MYIFCAISINTLGAISKYANLIGTSDISSITSLLEKVDELFLIGAEMRLKGYINSISIIKAKVGEQTNRNNQ